MKGRSMACPAPCLNSRKENTSGTQMKRDAVINVLLIIVGIALAIALFGAGTFWRSRVEPEKAHPAHTDSRK